MQSILSGHGAGRGTESASRPRLAEGIPVMGVLLVDRENGVCRLRLNRPDKLNALDDELLGELREVQRELVASRSDRVVLLSGEGRSFCAGADLTFFSSIYHDSHLARTALWALRDVVVGFEQLTQPVVCAVQGHVLAGGLEFALGCDIVVAARSARLGDQHIRRNLVPGGGATQRLPQRLGRTQAMDLLLTGRWLDAQEAWSIGLVSRVVEDDRLMPAAEQLAQELSRASPSALADIKRLVSGVYGSPAEGLEREIDAVMRRFETPEFRQSMEEFLSR
jgi:enoyl-CoA hydratase/carnithine racemase